MISTFSQASSGGSGGASTTESTATATSASASATTTSATDSSEAEEEEPEEADNGPVGNGVVSAGDGDDDDDGMLPPGSLADACEVAAMAADALACIRMYPFVRMSWCARTFDEAEILNQDIVKVTVHLERLRAPWAFDVDSFVFVSRMEPPESQRASTGKGEYEDDDGLDFVDNELEDARRLQIARLSAPVVHVNKFPFRVREKWLVMLVDLSNSIVIDQRAVPDLSGLRKVDLHFRAQKPRTAKYRYRLVVKCDSYLGADKHVTFELLINCDKEQRIKTKTPSAVKQEEDAVDYNIPDDDEEAHAPKWYYLWNENFWELLLTLFLLYFIYLVIMSSSFGKKYLQPHMDWLNDRVVAPALNRMASSVADYVVQPISKQLFKETGFNLVKWWLQLEDDTPRDNSGLDEDDILSEDDIDEEYLKYAYQQFETDA